MRHFHCEYAWLGGDVAEADVAITVDGDRITAISSGALPDPSATRLAGVTLPGLANSHSHAFHRGLRSATQVGTGSFWTWREQMYALAASLDPDSYYRLARAVYGEMVMAGITCVGEFHYLHHGPGGTAYSDPNAMGAALVEAANDAGLRITLLDTCYLRGGFDTGLNEVQQRFADTDALGWAARAASLDALGSPTCMIGAAVHSVRAVTPADIAVVTAWAATRNAALHTHVSELPVENEQCLAAYGLTPTALLAERGALSERFTAVHATHLTEADTDLIGAASCTVCLCPTTERDLADGIGPALALRDAGVNLCLGSDSNAVIDLFEEARAVELDERLASLIRGSHDAPSLLRAATVNGHASLGWSGAGTLAVGSLADFATVRLDTVRTAGAQPGHLLEAVVFAAIAADIHHVVIGGRVIVSDSRHHSIDVAGELDAAINELRRDR